MNRSDYDLIIFDCDGVLIDSELISAQTLIALTKPLGIQIDLAYVQGHFLGRSFPTVAATISRQFNVDLPADFEQSYRRTLLNAFETQLNPTDGVEAILAQLRIAFCVATSSSPERVDRSLSITGLNEYFRDSIFTASEVERGKPAPDLFLHVAAHHALDPGRCLVIEDSLSGIEAAQAAGMAVWRYVGGAHFIDSQPSAQHKGQSVRIFDSWSKFPDMIAMAVNVDDGWRNDGG